MQTGSLKAGARSHPDGEVLAYALGLAADERQREQVELHLLECDLCWEDARTLESAAAVMRSGGTGPIALTPESVATARLASAEDEAFGGHFGFALTASLLLACVHTAAVSTELLYSADRFGSLFAALAGPIFAGTTAAGLTALWLCVRLDSRPGRHGLEAALSVLCAFAGVAVLAMALALPHEPTIRASIATRTAFGGYFKNIVLQMMPLAVLYVAIPFHSVVVMERELLAGRFANVVALLSGNRNAFAPTGVLFVTPITLGWMLAGLALWHVVGVNYLLDRVTPSAYSGVFTAALYARVALWMTLAAVGLAWYSKRLDAIKQVGSLMVRLDVS